MEGLEIVLKATYIDYDGDSIYFLFDDYEEFNKTFLNIHNDLIESGYEFEFESVYSTRNEIEDIEQLEYKDVE